MYPNVEHLLVDTTGIDLLQTMKSWTDAMDEPAVNVINVMWITAILQQAKQRNISVMLEGASGNGAFSFETWVVLRQFFRRGRWLKLARTTRSLRQHGDVSLRIAARATLSGLLPKRLSQALVPGNPKQYFSAPLIPAELMEQCRLRERMWDDLYTEVREPADEIVGLLERFDFAASHAAVQAISGIEVRDPTADKRIYEFCLGVPPEQFVVGGHSRSLVRRAMRGRIPDSTLLRYKRGHQAADWYLPMTESLVEMRLEAAAIERSAAARSLIDVPRLNQVLDTWPQSGFEQKHVGALWHNALVRALSMGYFLRTHGGDERSTEA
jgi:asparagine synthase (glutamine-hydrolysing)